ncbi:MAG: hypothetical protein JW719_11610 [Pirellulales bacterium]|nr:hypothetical protein [Pirellulales bacterium]
MAGSFWHHSAPGRVRRAAKAKDAESLWSAWSSYLVKRKKPERLDRLFAAKRSPLLWAPTEGAFDRGTAALIEQLAGLDSKRASSATKTNWDRDAAGWIADSEGAGRDSGLGLEAAAWAAALPELAGVITSSVWWSLLDHLVALCVEASAWPVEELPLIQQLLAGEVALTLAYGLPEITTCRKMARRARRSLSAGMIDLLDGQGLPRAEHMPLLRPLLACWTRCRALAHGMKKDCFTRRAGEQFDWAVQQSLRWTRPDGSFVFGAADSGFFDDMITAALGFVDDEDDRRIAAEVLPGKKKASQDRAGRRVLPEASAHSEWSTATVLRGDWARRGPRLSVLYPGHRVLVEWSVDGDVVWSGDWGWEIRRDGKLLEPEGEWQDLCWVSDKDADYLELELELTGGVKINRQMVLAHKDRLVLLADAVLGDVAGRLDYRGWLPLAPSITTRDESDTREVYLTGGRAAVMALPLALSEWRGDDRLGALARTATGLELRQTSDGCSLYCPMLFDFDPRRAGRRRTWRQLTVAASLEIQPADVAVGYRVQLGREQWLIYRSLAPRANRTLLGHNLSTESLVARFDRSGEVEPLIEVE